MDDEWQAALQALLDKRFAEACTLWRRIVDTSARHFLQDNGEAIAAGNLELHSVSVLQVADFCSIHGLSPHNRLELFERAFVPLGEQPQLAFYRPIVAMYNLGLSYHLLAFDRNPPDIPRMDLLRTAEKFYVLCLEMVRQTIQFLHPAISPSLFLLNMAALNNHGHIQSHLAQHATLERNIVLILEALTFLLGQEHVTDPHEAAFWNLEGINFHDLAFFISFRFLPSCFILSRVAAAA